MVSILVNAAATLSLLAYITWSTRGASGDLKRTIIAAVRHELAAHGASISQLIGEVARLKQVALGKNIGASGGDEPETVRIVRGAPVVGHRVYATAPVGGQSGDLAQEVAKLGRQVQDLTNSIPRLLDAAREQGRTQGVAEGYVEGVRRRLKQRDDEPE